MWAAVAALALVVLALGMTGTHWLAPEETATDPVACDVGAKPANLSYTLKDMNGNDVRLSDFKGKVILLDFWATWCGPCKIEIPAFVELQNKYGKDGLVVLGFSVDDPLEKLKPFADQFKINYPVLVGKDRDEVQDAYGPIWGIPTTVLIGRDGRICKKHTGIASKDQFEKEIKGLL
jgi:cytochrome c biogenesis protein CcmG/thiol:disulfide interchange protein DsbE